MASPEDRSQRFAESMKALIATIKTCSGADKTSVMAAETQAAFLTNAPPLSQMVMAKWRAGTIAYRDRLMRFDVAAVAECTRSPEMQAAASLQVDRLLQDDATDAATKTELWKHIQVLTVLAHAGTDTAITMEAQGDAPPPQNSCTPLTVTEPLPPPPAATETTKAAPPARPDFKSVMNDFIESLPKFAKNLDSILKDEDSEVAKLARSFLDPQSLQAGVLPNLAQSMAAGAGGGGAPPAALREAQREMGGLSSDEIVRRLRRLENIERLHEAKKRNRH